MFHKISWYINFVRFQSYVFPRFEEKSDKGYALLTLVVILLSMIGSYKYYNHSIKKTDSQHYSEASKIMSRGDLFADNIINRIVSILSTQRDSDAICHGDTEDAVPGQLITLKREAFKFYRGGVASNTSNTSTTEILFPRGNRNQGFFTSDENGEFNNDVVQCLASKEELRDISKFKIQFSIMESYNCASDVDISVSGVSRLITNKNLTAKFERKKSLQLSPAQLSEFSVVFEDISNPPKIVIRNKDTRVKFESSVLAISKNNDGIEIEDIMPLKDDSGVFNKINFNERLMTNALSVDLSNIQSYGNYLATYPNGILLGAFSNIENYPIPFSRRNSPILVRETNGTSQRVTGSFINLKQSQGCIGLALGKIQRLNIKLNDECDHGNEIYANVMLKNLIVSGKGDLTIYSSFSKKNTKQMTKLMSIPNNDEANQLINDIRQNHREWVKFLKSSSAATYPESFEGCFIPGQNGRNEVPYNPNVLYQIR